MTRREYLAEAGEVVGFSVGVIGAIPAMVVTVIPAFVLLDAVVMPVMLLVALSLPLGLLWPPLGRFTRAPVGILRWIDSRADDLFDWSPLGLWFRLMGHWGIF